MLNPTYLEQLPEPVIDLVSELEKEIISDLTKRIVKGKYNTPSAEWMTYKANQLRLSASAVNKIIAKNAKVREKTVRELYTEAVRLALSEDAEVYRYAIKDNIISKSNGSKLNTYFRSIPLNDTFRKGLQNTNKLMRNLTNSMAATANKMLSDAMDLAWLETVSGAFTPDEAVFKAVTDLTGKGLKVVKYDSGRTDQVDVAVRRAIRTSVNKTAGDMQLDLASEMGCDLVEVTSHLGARPSHAEWQGQVYSISGKNPKYKPFSVTGYGTGDGLCGWNCRHSFYPYFEGLSERASIPSFTAEENLEAYTLSQKQRAYERAIRQSKRELAALDSARQNTDDPALKAKLDKQFERKSATLKNREQRLDSFCKQNGLQKDNSRVRTVGFDRSVSQKAVHAAKNYTAAKNNSGNGLTSSGNGGIINTVQESELGKFKTRLRSDEHMTKDYYNLIKSKFSQGSDIAKKAFNKYVPADSIANSEYEGTPYYDLLSKKISMHYGVDINNPAGEGATWFHEHGHLIDDACGKLSQDKHFRNLLDSDKLNYVKKVGKEHNLKTFPETYKYISENELSDYRKQSGVSDILHGLSGEQIKGCGFHKRRKNGTSYWNDETILSEAFAHMYEVQFDKIQYNEMKKVFPNALDYFEKRLEEAIK
ncbi:MAG: phage minor capsid protein [Oscillospiraceae bacterium]